MTERLRRVRIQLGRARRAIGLVWSVAPELTLTWGALLVVQALIPVASVYLTREFVDGAVAAIGDGATAAAIRRAALLAAGLAATLIAAQALQVAASWVRAAQAERVQDHIRSLVLRQSYAADLAFFESADYHDQLERARGDSSRPLALLESTGALLQNSVTLVGMAGLLVPYGAWVPLALVLSTLPALYVVVKANRRFQQWWQRTTADRRWATYHDWVLTYSEFAGEIRLFDLGGHFIEKYLTLRRRLRGERLRLLRLEQLSTLAASTLALAAAGLALAWMVWRVFRGAGTLGDLVLFYQAFDRGQNLMRTLLGSVGQIYANTLFLENLFDFLDLRPRVVDQPQVQPLPRPLRRGIEFADVSFRYPGSDLPALDRFSLLVPAGRTVALVGSNGAGKSTVIKLLCRFYDPDAGRVTLDGTDLRELSIAELRRAITILFQSPVPYHATVGRNIAYGDLPADPGAREIEAAAHAAGADEIVSRLPRSYDTLLGKWFAYGTQLSAGEWQRVALARAFVRRSDILVLDEPTSFMDSWAEAEWLGRFADLAAGRTSLIVTHRFSVALRADIVHVMHEGRILESGSPAELLSFGGEFARSWTAQMEAGAAGGTSRPAQPLPHVQNKPEHRGPP